MRSLWPTLRGAVGTGLGLGLTGLLGTLAVLGYPVAGPRSVHFWTRRWGRWVLWLGGVRVRLEGLDNVDPARPYVYVSNHQSGLDILVLVGYMPHDLHFVAKRELLRAPFVGWGLKLGGHIVIDRSERQRALHTVRSAADDVRAGKSVVVFPEGTRSAPGELRAFKRGAFVLARAAGVPLVPVGIEGSAARMPRRRLFTTPGEVRVRVGRPIEPERFPDDDFALAEMARAEVARLARSSAQRLVPPLGEAAAASSRSRSA